MCGLTGFWTKRNEQGDLTHMVQRMTDAITYRGPDDHGYWADQGRGVAFGHRRLSIIDLSPEGHQPMHSASGRFVMIYNGEIYNFEELRAELCRETGHKTWRGHSDTEVILEAIEHWGLEEAVGRFIGMFALALWDRAENTLHLVRDRLGIKPLYYGWSGSSFLFGSELHTLKRHPDFVGRLNQRAIGAYLRYRYIPSPESIYEDIYKLPPGSIIKLQHPLERAEPKAYWSAYEVAQAGVSCPFEGSPDEAVDALHDLLADAVKRRMVADVPLGAFLSGGVDSSAVVALMQAQSTQSVKTFTIGFNEDTHNEAHYAKAVAKHLGTDHTELYVTPEDAMAVIPNLPRLYDEPFADESQIPTLLVSELARRKVTVSLSGDGGDELFGGYTVYQKNQSRWKALERVPYALRSPVAHVLGKTAELPQPRLDALGKLLPSRLQGYTNADQMSRIAEYLNLRSQRDLHEKYLTRLDAHQTLVAAQKSEAYVADRPDWTSFPSYVQSMMYWDTTTFMPDDILVKLDRASMKVSLEARVPILDHRVVELAWRFPLELNFEGSEGKQLLRKVLYRYVPKNLVERPKRGFSVPIRYWLKGPLKDWADDLLSEERLEREGVLNARVIRQYWEDFLADRFPQGHSPIWTALTLQAWLSEQRSSE